MSQQLQIFPHVWKREQYPGQPGGPIAHAEPTATEARAAEKIAPIAATLRARVLAWYRDAGPRGLTAPEAGLIYAKECGEPASARREYSIRPRITELRGGGYLTAAGGSRDGAAVYVSTPKQGDASECRLPKRRRIDCELAGLCREIMGSLFASNGAAFIRAVTAAMLSRGDPKAIEPTARGSLCAIGAVERYRDLTGNLMLGNLNDPDRRLPPEMIPLGLVPDAGASILRRKSDGRLFFMPMVTCLPIGAPFIYGGIEFDVLAEV